MAKIMQYTDERGVGYLSSYWRGTYINIDMANIVAIFKFSGYRDKDARQENKNIIGEKTYTITDPDTFNTYYSQEISGEKNLMQIAYQIATETLFQVGSTVDENGIVTPIMESFFANATDDL